jgi:crotonobetainyl-CoA hydratase
MRNDTYEDGIRTAVQGSILTVTLDRPKANAIDLRASWRLNEVFTEFKTDEKLRVAIVTGAGERFFCPGWDLKNAAAGEKSDSDYGVGGFGGLNYPRNLDKPVIAAVNGIACGGGLEIVLGTDIIVMEEQARFALPEINVGVLADAGTIKLRRRIPYHVAVEFLMTGRWMDLRTTSYPPAKACAGRSTSRSSSLTDRRCFSPPSSSCCSTRKWCPNTRPSWFTTLWEPSKRCCGPRT